MRSVFFASFASFAMILTAGCAAEVARAPEQESPATADDELSTTRDTFVVLRADQRRCASPMCGGYWVRDANKPKSKESYVSALDLGPSGLADVDAAKVTGAPAGELVLLGRLGPIEPAHHTRTLLVKEAYRGLPGVVAATGESFYEAHDRSPRIECFAAPCNNEVAEKLNSSATLEFTALSVTRALKPFVDEAWVSGRVLQHGAIVSASVHDGAKMAAGYEKVVDASQVFVRIPDAVGPCPKMMTPYCAAPEVNTYSRSADRCEIPTGCATPGICPLFMPACQPGYTLSSWRVQSAGCNAYACDPTFLFE